MERVKFGRTGLEVTRIAFGGIPIQRLSRAEGIALVGKVLDEGVNFFDTAHVYGQSEELIGEALQGRARQRVVLSSKSQALEKDAFLADLEESLRRLKTDTIEIFHHHNSPHSARIRSIWPRR
jgi:aryl-alcohol dehydrogenase-like predicted oxidoreductase